MNLDPRGGVVVLAAGLGARFGGDKRMHRMPDGRTLLETTLARHAEVFEAVHVVLRDDELDLAATLQQAAEVDVTHAANWRDGMGASLAAGITDCVDWDYAFIALADMPWITVDTLRQLKMTMEDHLALSDEPLALRPTHLDVPGHPVGFTRHCFEALSRLTGDNGARELLRDADVVEDLPVLDPGVILDIDTPEAAGTR